jgi:hypothetical protein
MQAPSKHCKAAEVNSSVCASVSGPGDPNPKVNPGSPTNNPDKAKHNMRLYANPDVLNNKTKSGSYRYIIS